ncbi:MAG: cryptochrome/photolyase family protein [Chromatocurvus sp.]
MADPRLVLVLGDQLSLQNPALVAARPGRDTVLLAEVAEEAGYVPHNRHKIVLIFAAMRHFADALREAGFDVVYVTLDQGVDSLLAAVEDTFRASPALRELHCCEPGEYRLHDAMRTWEAALVRSVTVHGDRRFLASHEDFARWAEGRKQLRMEYFYRDMRKRYALLMDDDGKPEGGQWNYDADNRSGWRNQADVPDRPLNTPDAITREVIAEVNACFPDNPGDLRHFRLAVTASAAQSEFQWFCDNALGQFGTYQDALAEESPWLYHSLISMYLNIGLLEPLEICREVESRWRAGSCKLSDAEGFIRQVLGWREYVRGIYWLHMPRYRELNTFDADRPLPGWFWSGNTDMRCLSLALKQTLDHGYAHHIQRLMVIGNFALLAGLDVRAVCDWYLAVYVDAFEWVELPNTLGMALYGDGGIMASKPYAASGKYIQRQGNHCSQCRYDPATTTGEGACPYNALYWHFIDRHADDLARNSRMGLITGGWRKRKAADRQAILAWAGQTLQALD